MKSRNFVNSYGQLKELEDYRIKPLARIVYSNWFELLIAGVIAINAFSLAALTFSDLGPASRNLALFVDESCFAIYLVELLMRIISYGKKPWNFFRQGWNIFDFMVVAATPLFAGQTVVLRLLRLFRLVRIFRFLPEVKILSTSISKSLPPLLSMSALIALLLFLYGMVGYYLFSAELTQAWGDIGASMMTLIILLTLENFPVYLEEAMAVSSLAIPYMLSYVFIIVFTVLNLLIGIVLNAMDEARAESKEKAKDQGEFEILASGIEEAASDGVITQDEIKELRSEIVRLRKLLRQTGIG